LRRLAAPKEVDLEAAAEVGREHPRRNGTMNDRRTSPYAVRSLMIAGLLAAIAIAVVPRSSLSRDEEQEAATKAWSYVGSQKCKKCHIKQHKTWAETKMAKAFDILKPNVRAEEKKAAGLDPAKDYSADTTCLPCHTTGYGKPGGFVSLEETPELAGIGCEVCHGPGEGYLQDGFMTLKNKNYKLQDLVDVGLVVPDASTCTGLCHNTNSPFFDEDESFDWDTRLSQGTHEHKPLKYEHE
jgi:mono/diheme cytochrome c family protein